MNRWIRTSLPLALFAGILVSGCTQPDNSASTDTGKSATEATSGGSASTAGETGGTASTPEDPPKTDPAPTALADKPKDGDDVAILETSAGKIVVMFYPEKAPKHVENFKKLVAKGFYNGTRFHRCIPGFMIQGGDPKSKDLAKAGEWGTGGNMEGGKEVTVPAEFNDIKHVPGILSMARSQNPDSASSQFFIMVAETPSLDGQYSAFGKVVSGQEVADKIVLIGDAGNNGAVEPAKAYVLKSAKLAKWPVK